MYDESQSQSKIDPDKMLKRTIGGMVIFFLIIVTFFMFSVKVKPAEVAISVDLYGGDKGVEIEVLKTGRTFYNFITHDVIKYPAYIQQGQFYELQFQDLDGLTLSADISIDYKFEAENIPEMYQEYRKSANHITRVYFPVWIKNALVQQSAKMKVDEIYGAKKEEFRQNVLEQLRNEFSSKGVAIDNLYFTNSIQIPEAVKARINDKIKATQIAQQKENELQATEADVAKKIAVEEGKAKSRIIEANSRAKANRIISASLTKDILQFKRLEIYKEAIEKWNGIQPKVVGSEGLILDIGNITK